MAHLLKFCTVLLLCGLSGRADEPDNRLPTPVSASAFSVTLRDEVEVLHAAAASNNQELRKALFLDEEKHIPMRLKWNQRVSLKDADYVLCLFDFDGRILPGKNPRVVVLFTLRYEVAAWGSFDCESVFGYGSIINRLAQPDTYLITVNPSTRFGGALWFEEYRISPHKIKKLGEGSSYPIQPRPPESP